MATWPQAHESAQQDESAAGLGSTPTYTARREILPMRLIGTGGLAKLHPKVRLSKTWLTIAESLLSKAEPEM